jgi:hypothetical protein
MTRKFLFHPIGKIGTFLMAKKVSFSTCWENWHLSHGKESFFSILSGKLAPFSWQRFLFPHAGDDFTFLTPTKVCIPFQAGIFFNLFCQDKFPFLHTTTVFFISPVPFEYWGNFLFNSCSETYTIPSNIEIPNFYKY